MRSFFDKGMESVVTVTSFGEVIGDYEVYVFALLVSIQTLSNMRRPTYV